MKPIVSNQKHPITVETQVSIETFVALVRSGIEVWNRAGEILVKLVEQNPNVYAEIMDRSPSITFEMLLAFERMGRKQIYPPLLMDSSPGAKRLLELPYEVQEKFSTEPVEIVVGNDESPIVEKRYVKELTSYEARVAFDDHGPRAVQDQIEFKKKHRPQGRSKKPKQPDVVGTYLLKLSPSGGVVLEKSTATVGLQTVKLSEKDGVKQCLIRLI